MKLPHEGRRCWQVSAGRVVPWLVRRCRRSVASGCLICRALCMRATLSLHARDRSLAAAADCSRVERATMQRDMATHAIGRATLRGGASCRTADWRARPMRLCAVRARCCRPITLPPPHTERRMTASSAQARKQLPIRIGEITKDNFNQLRKLNQVVFPVTYSEQFYTNITKPDVQAITKLAWHADVVVGGICCRFESVKAAADSSVAASAEATEQRNNKQIDIGHAEQKRIYIMTLGVLAPYRGRGIGSKLLRQIVEYAESHSDIADVYLHVQVNNTEALDFYKKQGFENVGKIENYYKQIEPPDCYIVSKKFIHVQMASNSATLD